MDKNTRGDGVFTFGTLSHLLTWHVEHPVEQWEKDRNDAVCATQGNRNPFTDKPDLVTVVFGTAEAAAAMKSDTSDAAKGVGGGGFLRVVRSGGPLGHVGGVHLRDVQVVRVMSQRRCTLTTCVLYP